MLNKIFQIEFARVKLVGRKTFFQFDQVRQILEKLRQTNEKFVFLNEKM